MRLTHQPSGFSESSVCPVAGLAAEQWFAVQTRARHEKVVARQACERGITTFLPLVRSVHRWSDRSKAVDLPLFGCYLFVKLAPTNEDRVRVLRVDGVLRFVGVRGLGVPIPEEQIHAVQKALEEQLPCCSYPFLKVGQRVRVRSGALNGVEGILVARSGVHSLVISLDAIQKSLSIRIEGYDVEPV
jgi:transcription antitermination factor NusG